ncbi:MAG: trigger factor family protein [Paludibacteraceae bacterium]|nr:trigger factor family protein [Paludibacteraceae bacterium]
MNVLQNNSNAVNATLLVQVTSADYTEKVKKAINAYRRKAQFPGFRPGTYPVALIKKQFGSSFLAEEVNKLVSEALYDHITNNKIEILGEPLPTADFKAPELVEGNDFEFSFDIAIAPSIDLELTIKTRLHTTP